MHGIYLVKTVSGSLWLLGVQKSHMHDDSTTQEKERSQRFSSVTYSEDDQQRIDSIMRKLDEKHGSMFTSM